MAWNRASSFFKCLTLVTLVAIATVASGVAAHAAPAPAKANKKVSKATSQLESLVKQELKSLRHTDQLLAKEFELSLELVLVRILQGNFDPGDAAQAANEALGRALVSLRQHASATQSTAEAEATQWIIELDKTPANFRVGGHGVWDDFERDLAGEIERVESIISKRLMKFEQKLRKLAPDRIVVLRCLERPLPDLAAPGAADASPLQQRVRLFSAAGSSSSEFDQDGRLCLSGTADPDANGGLVHVVIRTAGAQQFEQDVVVDATGAFIACFPATGAPNLPEGNYRIIADQTGPPALAAINVPWARCSRRERCLLLQARSTCRRRGARGESARPGAGRKPNGRRAGVSRLKRPKLASRHPVHVTVRLTNGLPKLRRKTSFRVLRCAFAAGCDRFGFRLVHYSIQNARKHGRRLT